MNTIKTFILMLALSGLLLLAGFLIGGILGIIIALVISLGLNFFTYWFSDKMALSMAHAHEVSPEEDPDLHSIVDEQVQAAGIPKPKVYVINNDSPNAFATGRNPRNATIAVTTGIRRLLNRDELGGVIAHELAHVGNRDTLIMTMVATIAMAIGLLATFAQWAAIFGALFGGGRHDDDEGAGGYIGILMLLVMAIVFPIIATIIRLAISRAREYQADATGAHTSHNPLALASALEKLEMGAHRRPMKVNEATAHLYIVSPLRGNSPNEERQRSSAMRGSAFSGLFSTHPPIQERVRRLRNMNV